MGKTQNKKCHRIVWLIHELFSNVTSDKLHLLFFAYLFYVIASCHCWLRWCSQDCNNSVSAGATLSLAVTQCFFRLLTVFDPVLALLASMLLFLGPFFSFCTLTSIIFSYLTSKVQFSEHSICVLCDWSQNNSMLMGDSECLGETCFELFICVLICSHENLFIDAPVRLDLGISL